MILSAVTKCDPALQKAVMANIVVVGGCANTPGLRERLVWDLVDKAPVALQQSMNEVRVLGDRELAAM